MKLKSKTELSNRLEKIEAAYLLALRVAGLVAASLCLLAALFFAGDALWRFAVPTKVSPEPTSVNTEALARMVSAAPEATATTSSKSDPYKAAHDVFKRDVWPKYYGIYAKAAQTYRNDQAPVVSSDKMMDSLGYDLASYREASEEGDGLAPVVRLVNDATYQQTALHHVGEIFNSPAVKARLNAFTRAAKSREVCTTTPVTQTVRQVCGYYYVYDCSYTRTVQQRRCENHFPENVLSPAAAFEKADLVFAMEWADDETRKANIAQAKSDDRQALRDGIGPRFQMALVILAGFLVVMFFFLLIAIERHLRPAKPAQAEPSIKTDTPNADTPPTDTSDKEPDSWL